MREAFLVNLCFLNTFFSSSFNNFDAINLSIILTKGFRRYANSNPIKMGDIMLISFAMQLYMASAFKSMKKSNMAAAITVKSVKPQ